MDKTKQRKRNNKRRTSKASNFTQAGGTQKSHTAFPKRQQVVFRYSQSITLSGAGGAPTAWLFRLNSLYDPDYTSTGHQPFQYDQLMAIYNKYRVFTTDVKMSIVNKNSTAYYPAIVACYASNVNTAVSSIDNAIEHSFSDYVMLSGSAGGQACKVLQNKFTVASVIGYQQNIDDDLASSYNNSPSQVAYFVVMADHPNRSTAYDVSIQLELKFYAEVYDLISPGASLTRTSQQQQQILEEEEEIETIVTTKSVKKK